MNNLVVHRIVIACLAAGWAVTATLSPDRDPADSPAPPEEPPLPPAAATLPNRDVEAAAAVAKQAAPEEEVEALRLHPETRKQQQPPPQPEPATEADEDRQQSWLVESDRAVDHEFNRLETIENQVTDPDELRIVTKLKAYLETLERLWMDLDAAPDDAARKRVEIELQGLQAQIIRAGEQHRSQRLKQVAMEFGVTDPAEIRRLGMAVEQAMLDTDLDWSRLLSRAR